MTGFSVARTLVSPPCLLTNEPYWLCDAPSVVSHTAGIRSGSGTDRLAFLPSPVICSRRMDRAAWPVWCAWAGGLWSNRQAWFHLYRMARLDARWRWVRHSSWFSLGSTIMGISSPSHNAAGAVDQPQAERGFMRALPRSRRQSRNRAEPDAPRMGVSRPIADGTISARLPQSCATPHPVPHRPRGS